MVFYRKQAALRTVQVTVVPWLLGHFIRFTYAVLVEETGKICTVNESVEAASGIIYMLFMHNKLIFPLPSVNAVFTVTNCVCLCKVNSDVHPKF